ncbi:MAG TPA: trypsin-like peptidase domain-containing protein [Humisphaera sp.]
MNGGPLDPDPIDPAPRDPDLRGPYLPPAVRPPVRPAAAPGRPVLPILIVAVLFGALSGLVVYQYLARRNTPAPESRQVTPAGDLASEEKSTIELFKAASPSVTFITTIQRRQDLFSRSITEVPAGTGSGFVWDAAGHIVTNFHVIAGQGPAARAQSVRVTLADGKEYAATVVGREPSFDVAVLKVTAPPASLPPIRIGTSGDLQVGQRVFAIGNPFGFDKTLTTGVVSALGRTIQSPAGRPIEDVIQTDAPINPGNSGGPLLDSSGRLIGMTTAIFSPSGGSNGIGFAVPVDTVKRVVEELIASGRYAMPSLGVNLNDRVNQFLSQRFGAQGAYVLGVEPGSGAAEAQLRPAMQTETGRIVPGDVILQVNGRAVKSPTDVYSAIQKNRPGDVVDVQILREETTQSVKVRLGSSAARDE